MKRKGTFNVVQDGDGFIAVATGEYKQEFGGMIKLNETGHLLWKCLGEDVTLDDLATAICDEYAVSREVALSDAETFVQRLKEAGFIED